MTFPSQPARGPSAEEAAWQGTTLEGSAFGQIRLDVLVAVRRGEAVYRGLAIDSGAPIEVRLALAHAGNEAFLARHADDARALAELAHTTPHLVQVVASGTAVGPSGKLTAFVATESLGGRTLRAQLDARAKGGASLAEALVIFGPVVTALGALHTRGLSHGAFSPASIVFAEISGRSVTKVVDVTLGASGGTEPEPRLEGAELFYAAPEHFKRSYGSTGPATDVFALALVLVEHLSGERALRSSDPTDLYLEVTNLQKRPTPKSRGVSVSDAVEAVFVRALAVDPKKRYDDVPKFWEALNAAAEDRQSPVSLAPKALTSGEAALARRGERAAKATRRTLALLAVAATFLAGMGGSLYVRSKRAREAASVATASSPVGSASGVTGAVDAAPSPAPIASPEAAASSLGPQPSPDASWTDGGPPAEGAMIRVPPSAFPMGSDHESRAEKPMHRVVLSKAFFIDALEVTAGAYAACVAKGACTAPIVHFGAGSDPLQKGCNTSPERARHPANCVDQLQALKYCAFAGKRLPTEAEWELAARGTDGRDYPWGDAPPKSCAQGILRGLTGGCEKKLETFEVGLTPEGKSPFGVWDMSGNVWEWVADGFADYPATEVKDPFVAPGTGPDAKGVLRGGSFDYATTVAKTSSRLGLLRTAGHVSTGFRCAQD